MVIIIVYKRDIEHMRPEAQIQKEIVTWFRERYPRYILGSIPNEATHGGKGYNAAGICLGAPDLFICIPDKILWIEVKSEKGRLSDNQKIFQSKCTSLSIPYFVIRSLEEFKDILRENLYVENWVDL